MSAIRPDSDEKTASALIELLHQGAPADDFARRLGEVEALPEGYPGKSTLIETVRMAMAVRNRLEVQQQRERGMMAVIESAQDLSSRLDLNDLLGRNRRLETHFQAVLEHVVRNAQEAAGDNIRVIEWVLSSWRRSECMAGSRT